MFRHLPANPVGNCQEWPDGAQFEGAGAQHAALSCLFNVRSASKTLEVNGGMALRKGSESLSMLTAGARCFKLFSFAVEIWHHGMAMDGNLEKNTTLQVTSTKGSGKATKRMVRVRALGHMI